MLLIIFSVDLAAASPHTLNDALLAFISLWRRERSFSSLPGWLIEKWVPTRRMGKAFKKWDRKRSGIRWWWMAENMTENSTWSHQLVCLDTFLTLLTLENWKKKLYKLENNSPLISAIGLKLLGERKVNHQIIDSFQWQLLTWPDFNGSFLSPTLIWFFWTFERVPIQISQRRRRRVIKRRIGNEKKKKLHTLRNYVDFAEERRRRHVKVHWEIVTQIH